MIKKRRDEKAIIKEIVFTSQYERLCVLFLRWKPKTQFCPIASQQILGETPLIKFLDSLNNLT